MHHHNVLRNHSDPNIDSTGHLNRTCKNQCFDRIHCRELCDRNTFRCRRDNPEKKWGKCTSFKCNPIKYLKLILTETHVVSTHMNRRVIPTLSVTRCMSIQAFFPTPFHTKIATIVDDMPKRSLFEADIFFAYAFLTTYPFCCIEANRSPMGIGTGCKSVFHIWTLF